MSDVAGGGWDAVLIDTMVENELPGLVVFSEHAVWRQKTLEQGLSPEGGRRLM